MTKGEVTDIEIERRKRRDELVKLCDEFFETRRWQTRLAKLIEVTPPAVNAWMIERNMVPKSVLIALRALCDLKALKDAREELRLAQEQLQRAIKRI